MKGRRYRPRPIDTSKVSLPKTLEGLRERLARDTHEVWARQRLAEGWRWGPRRDDRRKRHPCLVPYEALPESERAYDRAVSSATLKAVTALGYRIEPPAAEAGRAPASSLAADGERALRRGEPLVAYDFLAQAMEAAPDDPRLRQVTALALARCGASERAAELLRGLVAEGHRDEETLGILARTHKDMAQRVSGLAARTHWRLALNHYLRAYRLHRGAYAGINAATVSLLLGSRGQGRRIAGEVRTRVSKASQPRDHWAEATLGEAALILGDWGEAGARYRSAAALARGAWADIASMRRQAGLLLDALRPPAREREEVEAGLRLPAVVSFVGRGRRALRDELARADAGFGYAAVFAAADLEFLEEMLARGAEIQPVLPCPASELPAYLGWRRSGSLARRLERILRRAARVHIANEFARRSDPVERRYCGLLRDGLARLRAQALGTSDAVVGAPPPAAPGRGPRRIKALLFADVVGFSKLTEDDVPSFVRDFLGDAAAVGRRRGRQPELSNTWGDALYLVFSDAEEAGRHALELTERIRAGRWRRAGLPGSLSFRIALHAGPVFECFDPVTRGRNFAGTHVSRAARIEPVTPPGQVYASQGFAALAAAQNARGFVCEYVGQVPLAKKYGAFPLYHVRRSVR